MATLSAFVPNALGDGNQEEPTYLTLSADSEPMRLDSLCVSCMKNVRLPSWLGEEPPCDLCCFAKRPAKGGSERAPLTPPALCRESRRCS